MSTLALRQAALLGAILGRWDDAALRGHVLQDDPLRQRGLRAYRSNGHALAERALAAAYPVVAELLGEESFGGLARAFWHECPPHCGDIAQWGVLLPDFLAAAQQLQDEAFLPDVARVEWALHQAATAADVPADAASFALLVEHEPTGLQLRLSAGTCVVASQWPVASIVNAHLHGSPGLNDAGEKLRKGVPETAIVWRQGFKPVVREAAAGEAAFIQAVAGGSSLGDALEAVPAFDFSQWLAPAVHGGLAAGVVPKTN